MLSEKRHQSLLKNFLSPPTIFCSSSPFSDKDLNEGERLRGRWLHNIRRHLLLRLQRIQVPRVRDNLLPAGRIVCYFSANFESTLKVFFQIPGDNSRSAILKIDIIFVYFLPTKV